MSTPAPVKITRIPSLKTPEAFAAHIASLGIDLKFDAQLKTGADSPLTQPIEAALANGKKIGNRWAIHPMEGWDGTTTGGITEPMVRRWERFGHSGAKLIWGGEAMAIRPDGRANPNQLIINEENKAGIAKLRETLVKAHADRYGNTDDLVIGFQLTHSGRFCRPHTKNWESRIAYKHPILDKKFNVTSDDQILPDDDIERLIGLYIQAAKIASEVGADFVDVKHCHGYLLHEFLGAFTRPGKFGGSFENRTRIIREVVAGIKSVAPKLEIGVRLSAFDFVPFKPDPTRAEPGKIGPGIPEDYSGMLPYPYQFGINRENPVEYDLTETFQLLELFQSLGIKLINFSAGSPYYNPHIQRPAIYPPSDGYQPAEDPLINVARQINVVRQLKAKAPKMITVGSGYSYLQEFLPNVAQHYVGSGAVDSVGLGRAVLSYPDMLVDATTKGSLQTRFICRTFSDCTTAPRNGLASGCYPLDDYYKVKPEAGMLKEIKKSI